MRHLIQSEGCRGGTRKGMFWVEDMSRASPVSGQSRARADTRRGPPTAGVQEVGDQVGGRRRHVQTTLQMLSRISSHCNYFLKIMVFIGDSLRQ